MATRDMYQVFLDRNRLLGLDAEGYDWVRIRKSTQFELTWNPQSETKGYIDSPSDTTELTSYQVSMAQETVTNGDEMYTALETYARRKPIGGDAVVPAMLVFPDAEGKPTSAELYDEATVIPDTLNTVDGVITFTINFNGTEKQGTVAVGEDGKVVFTEAGE